MPSFETTRFGVLEYVDDDVLDIPDGLIGLPNLRRWLLLDMDEGLPMRWLQSLDRPDFGVPVMPPVFFTEEYEVGATRSAAAGGEAGEDVELVSLIIATVHPGGTRITGNLRAPLVVDAKSRRGVQLALDNDQLSARQDIDYFKFGLAVAGESQENDGAEVAAAAEAEAEEPVPSF